jgi:hypothetical protein
MVIDAQSGQSAEKTLEWKAEVLTILRQVKEKELSSRIIHYCSTRPRLLSLAQYDMALDHLSHQNCLVGPARHWRLLVIQTSTHSCDLHRSTQDQCS